MSRRGAHPGSPRGDARGGASVGAARPRAWWTTTALGWALTTGLSVGAATAQMPAGTAPPETRAERSNYRETSSYADVMAFLTQVADLSPRIRLTSFGYSLEGRSLPLVVVGEVSGSAPAEVRATGRVRLFIQANIHAGEVCGKEALQLLLRAIAHGEHAHWSDSLVLLLAPIYNADGNERVRLTNRPRQHGPVGGMGQRANAQGLDLNRDHTKLESPEARALVRLLREYDPHVAMDLHTTNGTIRAYQLLYAPPLHPDTDAGVVTLLREAWLPAVTAAIKRRHGWDLAYYGNVPSPRSSAERGWYTYDHRPRYNTNYIGLRNRIGILSEAYAYAPFEERVQATLGFVREVVEYAFGNASRIRGVVEQADAASVVGAELTLRAAHQRSTDSAEILLGEVAEERHPYTGRLMLRRLDVRRPERMPTFGTFQATESVRAPQAYLVPPAHGEVLQLLEDHGITWRTLERAERLVVEQFAVDSTGVAAREYQGHRQRSVFGRYQRVERTVPAGTAVVSVAQPLGRLAFALLEPRSDDGVVNWNVLDETLEEARAYPILRLPADARQ